MSVRRYHDMDLVITDIDRRKYHRIVPMKLLVLGLGRTGKDCKQAPQTQVETTFNVIFLSLTANPSPQTSSPCPRSS